MGAPFSAPIGEILAIGLYEQAIAIAPDFAPLQANLAIAYAAKSSFFAPADRQCEERDLRATRHLLSM